MKSETILVWQSIKLNKNVCYASGGSNIWKTNVFLQSLHFILISKDFVRSYYWYNTIHWNGNCAFKFCIIESNFELAIGKFYCFRKKNVHSYCNINWEHNYTSLFKCLHNTINLQCLLHLYPSIWDLFAQNTWKQLKSHKEEE